MHKPCVSVVMVVCNADRFLAQAIESILAQSFGDFEFIIVDFGSTDTSKSLIAKYEACDKRVKFQTIPSCSLAEARNAACFLAQGRYLAIMDADDVSAVHRLNLEVEFMESHPEVGLVGGATEWIDSIGRSLRIISFPTTDDEIRSVLFSYNPFCQPTVLIRRDAFLRAGGYRSAFAPSEDYDLWLRIADHFRCYNLRSVVLKYRIHSNQLSLRKRAHQTLCSLAALASAASRKTGNSDPLSGIEEITPELLTSLGISKAIQQATIAREYVHWIKNMCSVGEYAAALNAITEVSEVIHGGHVEPWVRGDLYLAAAAMYWHQNRFGASFLTATRAIIERPHILGRPIKRLLSHKAAACKPAEC